MEKIKREGGGEGEGGKKKKKKKKGLDEVDPSQIRHVSLSQRLHKRSER